MINMVLISGGEIAGAVIGATIVLGALIASLLFLLRKKIKSGTSRQGVTEFVEFSGDNTKLFEIVDVGALVRPNATVVVPPTHRALIIRNGTIVNECGEGEYPLNENGETIRTLKVIYISKTVKVTINWGTKLHQRIEYLDPKVGKPVSVGAFGVMDVRVSDPKKFYLELVACFGKVFSTNDLQERILTITVDDTFRAIGKALNEKKLSYIEFTSAKYNIQTQVGNYLSDKFKDEFGFEVSNFIIENLNITKEQEEEIKQIYSEDSSYERGKILFERKHEIEERERQLERERKQAAFEDRELDDFIYKRDRDRLRDQNDYERKNRHEDEDRAWAREDRGRDYNERIQNKFMDTIKDVEVSRNEAEKVKAQNREAAVSSAVNAGHHCSICGAGYKPGAKYCPVCGAVIPSENSSFECPGCRAKVAWGTAFCPSCGHKFVK